MANTFTLDSKSGYGTYQGRYLQLSCTQTTDVATNKSTINWTLSSIGGESENYTTEATSVIIAGTQVFYCKKTEWYDRKFPAAKDSVSGSLVVEHNTDGSKSISISLTTGVYYGMSSTYNGTWTLDSIPRKATITDASDVTDVSNPSISFSNPGGFPMDVWLEPNPEGDHLCVRNNIPNTGSYTWELTPEEREELRNKCSGKPSCTIRLGLYSHVSGVTYHDFRDMTYTMTENDATKPSVSVEITLDNGYEGMYIQGKSRLKVRLSAEKKYGADIMSYWAIVEGKTYTGESFTTDVIQGSGSVEVVGYAKDSREFTGSASKGIEVTEYSKPLVIPIASQNAILCYRSDGNGNRIGNSTSVWLKAKRFYYGLNGKNACALQWRRKLITEEWSDNHQWEDLDLPASTDEYNGMIPGVYELKKSYTVQIQSIDEVGEYDIKTFEIPTQDVALHLGKGGKNVAVGTYCDYSEDHTFYSAWKAIFDKDVVFGGDILIGNNNTPLRDYILSVINGGG